MAKLPLPEYDDMDATALAAEIRKGALSPNEVLEAAIARIEARNPAINAVVHPLFERAREHGRDGGRHLPNGPFRGVPFALKDLKLALAGTPTTNSTRLGGRVIPEKSSVLAERYEEAGLQILGKTNTSEFGIMGTTESTLRGPCKNPWNHERIAGGSSGGSAAAVAARILPVAHGGDGGGSIRIPASCCGLFGLKPTRGRVTMAPHAGEAWCGYVQEHVLTRSVRDSAAFLDLESVETPGEPYAQPHKERPFLEEISRPPGRLRIAFDRGTLLAGTNDPACVAAVDDAVSLLTSLGHQVEEARPTFPKEELVRAYFLTVGAGTSYLVNDTAKKARVLPTAVDFEPATWMMALIGWNTSSTELLEAQATIHRAAREIAAFFEKYDVFVNSTIAKPPVKLGKLLPSKSEQVQMGLLRSLPFKKLLDVAISRMGSSKLAVMPNTELFNQTGQPAASVPLYWDKEGLPIGVQIASKFGGEAILLRLAAQLEAARPFAKRKPKTI